MKPTKVTIKTTISDKYLPRLSITIHKCDGVVVKMEHTLYVKGVVGAGKIPLTARQMLDTVANSVVFHANAGSDISDAKFIDGLFRQVNDIRRQFSVQVFELDLLKK